MMMVVVVMVRMLMLLVGAGSVCREEREKTRSLGKIAEFCLARCDTSERHGHGPNRRRLVGERHVDLCVGRKCSRHSPFLVCVGVVLGSLLPMRRRKERKIALETVRATFREPDAMQPNVVAACCRSIVQEGTPPAFLFQACRVLALGLFFLTRDYAAPVGTEAGWLAGWLVLPQCG
ncbi:hypothetical protein VTI74DRAFT_10929 [Chaetomium olivicolor]